MIQEKNKAFAKDNMETTLLNGYKNQSAKLLSVLQRKEEIFSCIASHRNLSTSNLLSIAGYGFIASKDKNSSAFKESDINSDIKSDISADVSDINGISVTESQDIEEEINVAKMESTLLNGYTKPSAKLTQILEGRDQLVSFIASHPQLSSSNLLTINGYGFNEKVKKSD